MKNLFLILSLAGISIFSNPAFSISTNKTDSLIQVLTQSKVRSLDSLIKSRFGQGIQVDSKFEIGCVNYVKEQMENNEIPFVEGQAHIHFHINSQGGFVDNSSLIEIFNERFDYLESLDLPISPNKYLIKTLVIGDQYFIVVALDQY